MYMGVILFTNTFLNGYSCAPHVYGGDPNWYAFWVLAP